MEYFSRITFEGVRRKGMGIRKGISVLHISHSLAVICTISIVLSIVIGCSEASL